MGHRFQYCTLVAEESEVVQYSLIDVRCDFDCDRLSLTDFLGCSMGWSSSLLALSFGLEVCSRVTRKNDRAPMII